jgi:hypothetical protein
MAVYSTAACDGRHKFGERQSQYGEYDADGVRQGGLIAFVRYFKDGPAAATKVHFRG